MDNQTSNSLLIKQSNAITESKHAMSAAEQNIMYMLISQLKDDDPKDKVYFIRVSELEKLTNREVNYFQLKEASQRLIGKVYRVRIDNEIISFAPLNSFVYKKGSGNILLQLSDKIRPFFFALKNNYTLLQFQTALKLKSKYSKRIYEMISQFKHTGFFKISVHELKERFELIDLKTGKEEYPNFNLFATYVLEVAKKEINEHTDLKFEYSTKKTGRKITDLEFRISCKEVRKELSESTLLDSGLVGMKERLVTKFRLSNTLAKKVIEHIPVEEIEEIMKLIGSKKQAGGVGSTGAYSTTLFKSRLDGATIIAQKSNSPNYTPSKPVYRVPMEPEQKTGEAERPIGYTNPATSMRSNTSISIGEHLAQIITPLSRPTQMNGPVSKEEEKLKNEKYMVWRKLYHDFGLISSEVDSLIAKYSLEKLKAAINKISEELEEQETPQESKHMIQRLKKQLDLV